MRVSSILPTPPLPERAPFVVIVHAVAIAAAGLASAFLIDERDGWQRLLAPVFGLVWAYWWMLGVPFQWSMLRAGGLIAILGFSCALVAHPSTLFALGLATSLASYIGLGRPLTKAYFGLSCPACGSAKVRGGDFQFTTARCRACDACWTVRAITWFRYATT